jgi:hypothetical protein
MFTFIALFFQIFEIFENVVYVMVFLYCLKYLKSN